MRRGTDIRPVFAGKRILLTGSDTQLGAGISEKLKDAGAAVVATRAIADDAWDAQFMDVSSFDAVLKAVAFHDPDAIVHCTHIVPDECSIYAAVSLIVQGTKNIVDMGKPLVIASDYISVEQGGDVDVCMTVAERMASDAGAPIVVPMTGCLPSERAAMVVDRLEEVLKSGRSGAERGS